MNILDQQLKKNPCFTITVHVAQWIARRTSNPKVAGSNPARNTVIFFVKSQILTLKVHIHRMDEIDS